jgi:SPP1 family predicted phage head-tail adaptor
MIAGALNRRISIQHLVDGRDELGQPVQEWVEFARAWASIMMVNGKEYIGAGRDVSEATASIRIRRREGITAAMRVVHQSTIYDIKAILPDEVGREHVDLVVGTGANNG